MSTRKKGKKAAALKHARRRAAVTVNARSVKRAPRPKPLTPATALSYLLADRQASDALRALLLLVDKGVL